MMTKKRPELSKLTPEQRKARRIRRRIRQWIVFVSCCLLALALVVGLVSNLIFWCRGMFGKPAVTQVDTETVVEQLLSEANALAAGYSYDEAIEKIKSFADGYLGNEKLSAAAAIFESDKNALVKWEDTSKIPHVFFHTLIKDTEKAFDGDYKEAGYNQYMATVSEFEKILDEMYNNNFVLVSIYDIAKEIQDENGNTRFTQGEIYLPAGKKPFVLSVDDVNYYDYMTEDGFASRLIIDDNKNPVCEYIEDDKTVTKGDFDIVPVLETFISHHPDFSYRGARGILALTGYNGVLGYKTCPSQENYNEADIEKAKAVAEGLKERGWIFASHSWGHKSYGSCSDEKLYNDAVKWEQEVEPIIGETDVLIYAHGDDISDTKDYSGYKYETLKACGFKYFCNVDSAEYWVQIRDDYVRQGRRNIDGYRMYYHPQKLTDLFEVEKVWDSTRPTPVPEIK